MTSTEQPRVVVGIDGSALSLGALREAAEQTRRLRGRLECVTVWELPTATGIPVPLPADFSPAALAHMVLDAAVEKVLGTDPDIPVTRIVIEGHASVALPAAAESAALLVVGNHGHHGPLHARIGSVADACVRHAPCPVLVVGPTIEAIGAASDAA